MFKFLGILLMSKQSISCLNAFIRLITEFSFMGHPFFLRAHRFSLTFKGARVWLYWNRRTAILALILCVKMIWVIWYIGNCCRVRLLIFSCCVRDVLYARHYARLASRSAPKYLRDVPWLQRSVTLLDEMNTDKGKMMIKLNYGV